MAVNEHRLKLSLSLSPSLGNTDGATMLALLSAVLFLGGGGGATFGSVLPQVTLFGTGH